MKRYNPRCSRFLIRPLTHILFLPLLRLLLHISAENNLVLLPVWHLWRLLSLKSQPRQLQDSRLQDRKSAGCERMCLQLVQHANNQINAGLSSLDLCFGLRLKESWANLTQHWLLLHPLPPQPHRSFPNFGFHISHNCQSRTKVSKPEPDWKASFNRNFRMIQMQNFLLFLLLLNIGLERKCNRGTVRTWLIRVPALGAVQVFVTVFLN